MTETTTRSKPAGRVVGSLRMRLLVGIVAGMVSAGQVRASFYFGGAAGATTLRWSNDHQQSIVARGELGVGWHFARWIGLEASAFGCATAKSDVGVWVVPATGIVPGERGPTPAFSPEGTARRRVSGATIGPVFSLPVGQNVRMVLRSLLLHARVREDTDAIEWYRPAQHTVSRDTGYEASVGLRWTAGGSEHWQIGVEARYGEAGQVTMTSLMGAISRSFDRLPMVRAGEIQPVYVTAGAGPAVLRWRTGDSPARVLRQHASAGWQMKPWLALEFGAAFFAESANTRRQPIWAFPLPAPVVPGGPSPGNVSLSPSVALLDPWSLHRRLKSAAVGPVFSMQASPRLALFTRQQAIRTTEIEWGHYVAASKRVHRDWGYHPGLGLSWQPTGGERFNLSGEVRHLTTPRVKVTAWSASGRLAF